MSRMRKRRNGPRPPDLAVLAKENPPPSKTECAIFIADSHAKDRTSFLSLAIASAKATDMPVYVIDTSLDTNAAEAWDRCQQEALRLKLRWWMQLGDDDIIAPYWWSGLTKAFSSAEYLTHAEQTWRITCTGMYLIDARGWPFAVIETPNEGFHRTDIVAGLGGYTPYVRADGSHSDSGLNAAATAAGYGTITMSGVWYSYRLHGLASQSSPDKRMAAAIHYANQTGDYLKIWGEGDKG